ncbi:MAG: YCF48-related protein, partial [Bacteroidota bacterium]
MKHAIGFFATLLVSLPAFSQTGGSGWTWQNPRPHGNDIYALDFPDDVGSVVQHVGARGTIARSTDGGSTYTIQTAPTENDLYDITFIDQNTLVAVGMDGIFRTTNGGQRWNTVLSSIPPLLSVDSYQNTIVTAGFLGIIRKSTDGGQTFTTISPVVDARHLTDFVTIRVMSSATYFASGLDGNFYRTDNGGLNWMASPTGTLNTLTGMSFINLNRGMMCGLGGTGLFTTNGGMTWFPTNTGTSEDLLERQMVNDNTAYTVGRRGTILLTVNFGGNYTQQNSGTMRDLFDIQFGSINTMWGYAVGGFGIHLETTNGGATWFEPTTGLDADELHGLFRYLGSLTQQNAAGDTMLTCGK